MSPQVTKARQYKKSTFAPWTTRTISNNSSLHPKIWMATFHPMNWIFSCSLTTDSVSPECLTKFLLLGKETRWNSYWINSECPCKIPVLDLMKFCSPAVIPQCTYDDYLYDPGAHRYAQPCTEAHCGKGALFDYSSGGNHGACTCTYRECMLPCWARPFVLAENMCFKMVTRVRNSGKRRYQDRVNSM